MGVVDLDMIFNEFAVLHLRVMKLYHVMMKSVLI